MTPAYKSLNPPDASMQQFVLSIIQMLIDDANAVRIDYMERKTGRPRCIYG